MMTTLKYESIVVPLRSAQQIHMTRFYRDKKNLGIPVFILHTIFQDSRSFFASDGSGLACFLAREGYDVYVADLQGRGKSWPGVNAKSSYGSHQIVNEDIPALLAVIAKRRGPIAQIWIGHGWGGVLLSSFYARFGAGISPVMRMVHFAVRRRRKDMSSIRRFLSDFTDRYIAPILMGINGFLPAKVLRFGRCNESRQYFRDYMQCSMSDRWLDPEDGFSYSEASKARHWPASFYFAAEDDTELGSPADVRRFVTELGPHDGRLMVLSRENGNSKNYSHTGMVSDRDADSDHFPILLDWLPSPKTAAVGVL